MEDDVARLSARWTAPVYAFLRLLSSSMRTDVGAIPSIVSRVGALPSTGDSLTHMTGHRHRTCTSMLAGALVPKSLMLWWNCRMRRQLDHMLRPTYDQDQSMHHSRGKARESLRSRHGSIPSMRHGTYMACTCDCVVTGLTFMIPVLRSFIGLRRVCGHLLLSRIAASRA